MMDSTSGSAKALPPNLLADALKRAQQEFDEAGGDPVKVLKSLRRRIDEQIQRLESKRQSETEPHGQ